MAITRGTLGNVDDLGWMPPDGVDQQPWISYVDADYGQYYGDDAEGLPDDVVTDDDYWCVAEWRSGPVVADVITAPTQYIEDAFDWEGDGTLSDNGEAWTLVEAASGPVVADNITPPTQYIEDAWDWNFEEDQNGVAIPGRYQQNDLTPCPEDPWEHCLTEDDDYFVDDLYPLVDNNPVICIEDPWEHCFLTDEDEYAAGDDYASVDVVIASTQYYGEDAELLDQEDDERAPVDDSAPSTDGVAAYYGEEAELADQDDDDQVVVLEFISVDNNPVICIEDGWDWWSQDEDEYAVSEDYENDVGIGPEDPWDHWLTEDDDYFVDDRYTPVDNNPVICVEDPWDHWLTEDDDYVVIDDYILINFSSSSLCVEDGWDWSAEEPDHVQVPAAFQQNDLTPCPEDGWDHYAFDDADDEWQARDTDSVGATPAQVFDDPWEHWLTEEDDQALADDYQNEVGICVEDPWDWTQEEDDAYLLEEFQNVALVPTIPEDPWDWEQLEDDQQPLDEYRQALTAGALTGAAIGGAVAVGALAPVTVLTMNGTAVIGAVAVGRLGLPQLLRTLNPRVFNGSNSWLGYRGAGGHGVYG